MLIIDSDKAKRVSPIPILPPTSIGDLNSDNTKVSPNSIAINSNNQY